MRFLNILIIICVMIMFNCMCNNANSHVKSENRDSQKFEECVWQIPCTITHYPITPEYYQSFMNSEIEFSAFDLYYSVYDWDEHPNPRKQFLRICSYPFDRANNIHLDHTLSDIAFYNWSTYSDLDINQEFKYDLPAELVLPMLMEIQEDGDYFLNAEEYEGEESLEFYSFADWKPVNYISLMLSNPNMEIGDIPESKRAFIKHWPRDEDPPEELLPLIDFIENVILPEMRQHPYPPPEAVVDP